MALPTLPSHYFRGISILPSVNRFGTSRAPPLPPGLVSAKSCQVMQSIPCCLTAPGGGLGGREIDGGFEVRYAPDMSANQKSQFPHV